MTYTTELHLSRDAVIDLDSFFQQFPAEQFRNGLSNAFVMKKFEGAAMFYLISESRQGGVVFVYEMITRWLLPPKKMFIQSFNAAEGIDSLGRQWLLIQLSIPFQSESTFQQIKTGFNTLCAEVLWGLHSRYQMQQVLHSKGVLYADTIRFLQERALSLVHRFPRAFDFDLFPFMHRFLLSTKEGYTQGKSIGYILRCIVKSYLLSKSQKNVAIGVVNGCIAGAVHEKNVCTVLGIIRIQNESDIFTQTHFIKAIADVLGVRSLQIKTQVCLEDIEKRNKIFSVEFEVKESVVCFLKKNMPIAMQSRVEKRLLPLFKPRNEEEVLKNAVSLAKQVRAVRDLPHTIISFEGHSEKELEFTVITVRIVTSNQVPIKTALREHPFIFVEKVKKVGLLRKKFPKEASVCRIRLPLRQFLRDDFTINYVKAREAVLEEIERVFGEVRDVNGGMLLKQKESLAQLKKELADTAKKYPDLLEGFHHTLFPVEIRTALTPQLLAALFRLFIAIVTGEEKCKSIQVGATTVFLLRDVIDQVHVTRLEQVTEAFGHPILRIHVALHGYECAGIIAEDLPADRAMQLGEIMKQLSQLSLL